MNEGTGAGAAVPFVWGSMGKRSGIFDHEADFLAAPIAALDREIARCEARMRVGGRARNRKWLESRIHWLGKVRTRHPEATS